MQSLKQFVKEESDRLKRFEQWWIKQNKKNPKMFPMEMQDGNKGLWFEQFLSWSR